MTHQLAPFIENIVSFYIKNAAPGELAGIPPENIRF